LIYATASLNIDEADMLIKKMLPFVENYTDLLNSTLTQHSPGMALSKTQKLWLGFCITGIILTNSINWSAFSRISVGQYKKNALSWMFRNSKIAWEHLFHASLSIIFQIYDIVKGVIGIDDSDKKRSKCTTKIFGVHKIKDKPTGGFCMGQGLVFLILITPKITVPIGYAFHIPDPAISKWFKEDKKLKKAGVPKSERPKEPARSEAYPTIAMIANELLRTFVKKHPTIKIEAVVADALYGNAAFMDEASKITGTSQIVSQLRNNQNILFRNKKKSVKKYFESRQAVEQTLCVRGGKEVTVSISCARLHVCAHNKKRFVIALKYEGEKNYRYLVATDLTWQNIDIAEVYTLRWLVEVFIQDHKANEGWGKLTKQPGEEGSYRSLTLSLLVDHCLLLHPDQVASINNKLPAKTVGSLCEIIKIDSILSFVEEIIYSDNPESYFKKISVFLKEHFVKSNASTKHMNLRPWGRHEPTPSLKYKACY